MNRETGATTVVKPNKTQRVYSIITELFSQRNKSTTPLLLNENIRYRLEFNQGEMSKDDIMPLIDHRFDMISLFLTAKFFHTPGKKLLLEEIMNNPTDMVEICKQYLLQIPGEQMIDAHKLQYLSLIGFETTSSFDQKINQVDPLHQQIPVILLHGGLLGLKSVIKYYDTIIFRDDTSMTGMQRSKDQPIKDIDGFSSYVPYLLIDDTIQTGQTIDKVQQKITASQAVCFQCVPFHIPCL